MLLNKVLKLGNPKLHEVSLPVEKNELPQLKLLISELHDILMEFKSKYNAGRAIAAPQIGIMKRLIYLHIEKPVVIINPELFDKSSEMIEIWDDCLCFPDLLVRVHRHQSCKIRFFDQTWNKQEWHLSGDLAELLQHEYDHLDGILATQRAIDDKSFQWRGE
ncbi:MAG: formylmethionine deformylase [Bacteroides sp. SM23_62_1]|nr:MAG: formylmethionine deformylase [Bacteroides sp. SM23_62_1]